MHRTQLVWVQPRGEPRMRRDDHMETSRKSRFSAMLVKANGLDLGDLKCWVFCPGMLFTSLDKWWGDFGQRDFPHEGIDFCLFRDSTGQVRRIDEKTRIPVVNDGVVRAIFKDYLGKAVVVEHGAAQIEAGTFLSVYAHTAPLDGIAPGTTVAAGDIIATIAGTRQSKARLLPHLHFTLGRPSPKLSYDAFIWNHFRNPGLVALRDPLITMDWPYEIVDRHVAKNRLRELVERYFRGASAAPASSASRTQ